MFTGAFLKQATPGASYSAPYVMVTYVFLAEQITRPIPRRRRHVPRGTPTATTAGALLAGLPSGWAGGVYADDWPGNDDDALRHHRAHRLRADRHGARARLLQEVRHQVGHLEGSVVGGHPRQAVARREPGDAHADRHAARVDDGAGGIAGEADGDSLAAQSQRPGDHAEQQAEGGRRPEAGADQAAGRQGQGGRRAADVRDDVSARHARDVDALLAGVGRHPSRQGRQPHHHPAAADGRQHEGRQDGRLLRRRAVEQPRHRGRHRLHGDDDAADVEGPSGEGVRVHRRVRDEEPEDGEGDAEGAAPGERATSTRWRTAPRLAEVIARPAVHQLSAGDHPRAAAGQVRIRRRPRRSRIRTT